jgi:hypothetical protein
MSERMRFDGFVLKKKKLAGGLQVDSESRDSSNMNEVIDINLKQ